MREGVQMNLERRAMKQTKNLQDLVVGVQSISGVSHIGLIVL